MMAQVAPNPEQPTLRGWDETLEHLESCWSRLDHCLIPDCGHLCLLRVYLKISLFFISVCSLVSPF